MNLLEENEFKPNVSKDALISLGDAGRSSRGYQPSLVSKPLTPVSCSTSVDFMGHCRAPG